MSKHVLIVLSLILVTLLGLISWGIFQPPAPRPKVTVRLSGYTNTAGTRFAMFAVSNSSSTAVLRLSHYRIQIPGTTRSTDVSEGWLASGGSVLPAGGVETVAIPAPTNLPWRVSLHVSPDVGVMQNVLGNVLGSIAEASRSVGLRPRYRKVSYGVPCEWIRE